MRNSSFRNGFTLIEITAVIVLIGLLLGLGAWRLSTLRTDSQTLAKRDALATVQRMEELAALEQLSISQIESRDRLIELQSKLLAKGHTYNQFNPTKVVNLIYFTGSQWAPK